MKLDRIELLGEKVTVLGAHQRINGTYCVVS